MPHQPMTSFRDRQPGLVYGGDYNPEQWPAQVWGEDVALMGRARVGLVSVGVFAWSAMEPADGRLELGWLDDVMDRLHAGGVQVNLATPNASPPPWLAEQFPETLMTEQDGTRVSVGGRGHFCPSSPVYQDRSRRIARTLAERYAGHPALAMWHVGNEYHSRCFCDLCDAAFRDWLQSRYGDLDELNRRWGTLFWSQRYSDWSQVHLPRPVRGQGNPAKALDWARFNSEVQLDLFRAERDLLRQITPDVPVTTNFMQFFPLVDYQRWAAEVDVVALDIYPDPARPDALVRAALNYDLMRSMRGGEPFMLMEQAAGAVSQWRLNLVKQPGRMRLGSYQAVAHGADAVMFFQWRASRYGQEKFHSAMLPHGGTATRTWQEVEHLGQELEQVAAVAGSRVAAEVAVVWDWENWWAVEGCAHPLNDFSYVETVVQHYTALWRAGVATDVVNPVDDLSRYRFVVVPNQYLITPTQQEALRRFVTGGGHLLVSWFSGIVDGDDQIIENGYPGGLRELIGGHVRDFSPLAPDSSVGLRSAEGQELLADGLSTRATRWQDDLVAEGATVVAEYADGHLAGQPALLDHAVGEGSCVYLGTTLDQDSLGQVVAALLDRAGVGAVHPAPVGVETVERSGERGRFLFLLNHTGDPLTVDLERDGTDLLTGRRWHSGEQLSLDPAGVAVLASDPVPTTPAVSR